MQIWIQGVIEHRKVNIAAGWRIQNFYYWSRSDLKNNSSWISSWIRIGIRLQDANLEADPDPGVKKSLKILAKEISRSLIKQVPLSQTRSLPNNKAHIWQAHDSRESRLFLIMVITSFHQDCHKIISVLPIFFFWKVKLNLNRLVRSFYNSKLSKLCLLFQA